MPKGNLYSAYKAAGSTAGKYQGSWYAQQGIQGERAAESMISDVKVEGIQQTTAAITEGLGLVSNLYEGHKSKKEMATAAKGIGAVEQEQGFMDWFMGGEKSYKVDGDVYTGTQVKAKYESQLYGADSQSSVSKILTGGDDPADKPGEGEDKPSYSTDKTLEEENARRKKLGLPPLSGKNPTKTKKSVSTTKGKKTDIKFTLPVETTEKKSGVLDKIKSALNIGGDEASMWDETQEWIDPSDVEQETEEEDNKHFISQIDVGDLKS